MGRLIYDNSIEFLDKLRELIKTLPPEEIESMRLNYPKNGVSKNVKSKIFNILRERKIS